MGLENGILVRNDKVRSKRSLHSDLVGQFVSHDRWVNTSETDLCVQMEVGRRQILIQMATEDQAFHECGRSRT